MQEIYNRVFPKHFECGITFHGIIKFYRPSDTQLTVWKCVIRNSYFTGCCLLRNKTIHANPLLKAAQAFTLQGPQASSEGNDSVSASVQTEQDKAFLSGRLSNTEVRIMQGDSDYILKVSN